MTSKELQNTKLVQKINLEALEHNCSLEQKWEQFKKEYTNLQTCLEEFPKELSAPILMPLGSKVFVRAQLCNTNEVFIRYNEIFTKQTAYEAKAVCERSIKRCDDMIASLTKEKQLLSDNFFARQEIVTDTVDSDEVKEIHEPFNEEEHKAWKELHRQKVKEYKQQLLNEKKIKAEACEHLLNSESNDLRDVLEPLYMGRETVLLYTSDEDSDDDSINEDCDDENDDEDVKENDIDDDDDDKLEIVFTNDVPETTKNFKKILKKKVSFNNDVQIKEFEPRPEEYFIPRREETINEIKNSQILVTQIDDIVEKVSEINVKNELDKEEINTRPMSRFKANRTKSNNS